MIRPIVLNQVTIGIGFTGTPFNARQIASFAKKAEERGVSSFWIAEDYFLRDAVTLSSCAAFATNNIRICTGVLTPFTRNPVLLAQTSATLNELSKGRIGLVIGTGERSLIESMGVNYRSPIASMTESIKMIRTLLNGEELTHSGRVFSASKARIGCNPYLDPPKENFIPSPVKIHLAAIGPKMLELSAQLADGVLLTAGLSARKVADSQAIVSESLKREANRPDDFEIAGYILCCYGKPSRRLRRFVADAVNIWPDNFLAAGISESSIEAISSAFENGNADAAHDLVNDNLVNSVAATGSKRDIERKVEEFVKAGLSHPVLFPFETDVEPILDLIGDLRQNK